ncbi:nucleolus protein required for cell viability [Arthroderma uncinatum]|uniref:nucleolus protein required for cell viability n=1 Tax=Arthroderma uncinatum TaxID=74035 RepID=UPI00144ADC24|nr:nucleolus protein required for cell viability [Arthroderma uncinatum]KAF3483587.1 nucleolus protein required for cell viability [Arthroderma uncinatum]
MSVQVVVVNPVPKKKNDDDADLSEEQIQNLLLEAEERLRKVSGSSGKKDEDGVVSLATGEVDDSSSRPRVPNLNHKQTIQPYVQQSNNIATVDKSRLVSESAKKLAGTIRTIEQPLVKNKEKPTSGPKWFDLPKTVVTPELKRDLQILRMRSVLDPHRHYKKENGKANIPEYSQVGTIIEGPTEFFSARITKKERKNNFAEEVMAAEKESGRFKRKYAEIQEAKTSGKKAYYQKLKAKRARPMK